MKKNFIHFACLVAFVFGTDCVNAGTVYDNNISALNINMLSNTFMSYAQYYDMKSDLFPDVEAYNEYGYMRRIDQYGDDGTTLKSQNRRRRLNLQNNKKYDILLDNFWGSVEHINGHAHYDLDVSSKERFYLATIGVNTTPLNTRYGSFSFGGFFGYIGSDSTYIDSRGVDMGFFSNYKFYDFTATFLADFGLYNNDSNIGIVNNSWINLATDLSYAIRVDNTLYFKPSMSVGYVFYMPDDFRSGGYMVSTDNYNFLNLTPGAQFIKKIVNDWYGTLSVKYHSTLFGHNKINVGGTKIDGLDMENYTNIGLGIEHNYRDFIFNVDVNKRLGGFDDWSGKLTVKRLF